MNYGDRKKKILAAVIECYIETAEPVGSKTLVSKTGLGVSSATIRNEMAELEALGWLVQPHTSAGRIPSALGYRAYVNELLGRRVLSEKEKERAGSLGDLKVTELSKLLTEAAALASEITGYPIIAVTPRMNVGTLRKIDLITIDADRIVTVIVTSAGIVKHRLMYTAEPVPYFILTRLEEILSERLTNLPISELSLSRLATLEEMLGEYRPLLSPVIRAIREMLNELWSREVIVEGESRLLDLSEYKESDKARELIALLHDKERILKVLRPEEERSGIRLTIGNEHLYEELRESSILACSYRILGKPVGVIALIGPTRMDYGLAMARFENFMGELNSMLAKMYNE